MRIRPSAIVFDYGNVLSAPQGSREIAEMASLFQTAVDVFQQAYWTFRLDYDAAAFDPASYWNLVARSLSRSVSEAQIEELVEADSRSWAYPAAVLPEWARNVRKAGFKTGLLSNMPTPVREHVAKCEWLPQFDHRTFSCDVRSAKPAPEIFRHCLKGLDVEPAEVLFLDDKLENVRAAETLGIQGVVYTTVERAAQEIGRRFDIPMPPVDTLEYGK